MMRLSQAALKSAAEVLDVALPILRAVKFVESRGEGFYSDGRVVILFERHIMYRRLKAAGRDAVALAVKYPNVVNMARGGYLSATNSGTTDAGKTSGASFEHARLALAMNIDKAIAIESTSWGLFQIMGFHWMRLGYASALDFMRCMTESEAQQLEAFVRFVQRDTEMLDALRQKKWPTFALRYNGPAYRENRYNEKLANAYDKFNALASLA